MFSRENILNACHSGNTAVIEQYLSQITTLNIQDSEGNSPLQFTAANGFNKITSLLMENGASVDLANNYGWTPLMQAVKNGHTSTVSLLLKKKAKVNIYNKLGLSPATIAAFGGHMEILRTLYDSGAIIDLPSTECNLTCLMAAAIQGHEDVVMYLLEKGVDANQASSVTGLTPLIAAANNGHLQIVRIFVEWGCDTNAVDISSRSAFDHAQDNHKTDVVKFLDSVTVSKYGNGLQQSNDIFHAIRKGDALKVKSIISETPATLNAVDSSGSTPLMLASMLGDDTLVRILIANGANLDQQDSENGWTALMYGVFHRHSDTVELLLEKGADIDIQAHNGSTALDLVPESEEEPKGADTNSRFSKMSKLISGTQMLTVPDFPDKMRLSVPGKLSFRKKSGSQNKSWFGSMTEHLQTKIFGHFSPRVARKASKVSEKSSAQTTDKAFDESLNDVFIEQKPKALGSYMDEFANLPPEKHLAHLLKEHKVEALKPPFPDSVSTSFIFDLVGTSPQQLAEKKKLPPRKRALQIPRLLQKYYEQTEEETVFQPRKGSCDE